MARRSTTDRLESLRQKRVQLDAQLRALEARNKQAERKSDTRRKVIAGALALEHFEANRDSEFGRIMFRLLDEYVVRPHVRFSAGDRSPRSAGAASRSDCRRPEARAGREIKLLFDYALNARKGGTWRSRPDPR